MHSGKKLIRLLTLMIFFGSVISVVMIVIMTSRLKTDELVTRMTKRSVNSSAIVIEFMEPVTTILKTMNSWGRTGKLSLDNPVDVSLMLVPLLDNKPMVKISGVSVADSTGRNLFLYREDDRWFTRFTSDGKRVLTEISGSVATVMMTEADRFDPRSREWFKSVVTQDGTGNDIRWSGPYMFHTKEKTGVTASLKSISQDTGDDFQVIACDILLADLKTALVSVLPGGEGHVFMMAETGAVSNLTNILRYDVDRLPEDQVLIKETTIPESLRKEFISEMTRAEQEQHTVFSFKEGGRPWWGSISPTPSETGIAHLCIAVPESVLTADIKPVKYTIFIISFSILAVAALVLTWVAGKYGKRLDLVSAEGGYVAASPDEIVTLINKGESEALEFKSTLRLNLKTEKNGKEIELASLKTIVAFMNSGGGTLLIGVGDDGSVLGLEPDNFENDDKVLLHFNGLFAQHIGLEFAGYISFDLKELNGKKILVVDSRKSDEPVFLKNKSGEEFYVRVGPGSRKLSTSEVIEYLKTR